MADYQEQDQSLWRSMLTPSNILRMSYIDPDAYSLSKGFRALPFGGNLKRAKTFYRASYYYAKTGNPLAVANTIRKGIFGGGGLRVGAGIIQKGDAIKELEKEIAGMFEKKLMGMNSVDKGVAKKTSQALSKRFMVQHSTKGFASMSPAQLAGEMLDPKAWQNAGGRASKGFEILTGLKANGTGELVKDNISKLQKMMAYKVKGGASIRHVADDVITKFGITGGVGGTKALAFGTKAAIGVGRAASVIGAIQLGAELLSMVGLGVGQSMVDSFDTAVSKLGTQFKPEMGGNLNAGFLSRGAATERQRAINAMSKAHMNGRSAFGQEASFVH